MNHNFLDIINKGAPISTPINIPIADLYELSDNVDELRKKLHEEFSHYMKFLNSIIKDFVQDEFMNLCILSNPDTLEKKLHFSPFDCIQSLLFHLNVNNICSGKSNSLITLNTSIDLYLDMICKRNHILRMINSEKELKQEFPLLYEDYLSQKKHCNDFKKTVQFLDNPNNRLMQKAILKKNLYMEFLEAGIEIDIDALLNEVRNFSIQSFCNEYADTFEEIIEHYDEIMDYINEHPLEIDDLGIESEKFELYIASLSMLLCEHGNSAERQRFIYYVSSYFNSDKERKSKTNPQIANNLKIGNNEKYINPSTLYHRYRLFLSKNPEIQIVDFSNIDFEGMTLQDVENFLFEYVKGLQANWELLPEGELDLDIARIISNSNTDFDEDEKLKYQNHLMDLLVEKKELYGKTTPFFIIRGKDTFDGYIGFVYPNGKVILDKFFENAAVGKIADGEAIYVMNVEDFYRLSQFSKSTLIKDSRVLRFYHAGSWKDKVLQVIQSGSHKKNTIDEVQKLIDTNKLGR